MAVSMLPVVVLVTVITVAGSVNVKTRGATKYLSERKALSEQGDGRPVAYQNVYHRDGSYRFGYDTGSTGPQSFREEHRNSDGEVSGRYGFIDNNGLLRITEYVAGRSGYRSAETIRYPVKQSQMKFYALPTRRTRKRRPLIGGLPVWPAENRPIIKGVMKEIQMEEVQ